MERGQLGRRIARRQVAWGLCVNLFGVGVAFAYLAFVFPPDPDEGRVSIGRNVAALAVYLPLAMTISTLRVRSARRATGRGRTERRPRSSVALSCGCRS
ncbi:MAG: hypothetical protein ACRDLA_14325 [Thermoleophilaceae bacterium]